MKLSDAHGKWSVETVVFYEQGGVVYEMVGKDGKLWKSAETAPAGVLRMIGGTRCKALEERGDSLPCTFWASDHPTIQTEPAINRYAYNFIEEMCIAAKEDGGLNEYQKVVVETLGALNALVAWLPERVDSPYAETANAVAKHVLDKYQTLFNQEWFQVDLTLWREKLHKLSTMNHLEWLYRNEKETVN